MCGSKLILLLPIYFQVQEHIENGQEKTFFHNHKQQILDEEHWCHHYVFPYNYLQKRLKATRKEQERQWFLLFQKPFKSRHYYINITGLLGCWSIPQLQKENKISDMLPPKPSKNTVCYSKKVPFLSEFRELFSVCRFADHFISECW